MIPKNQKTFTRTVTYEVMAENLDEALEFWEDHGPETSWRVQAVASSNLEEKEQK